MSRLPPELERRLSRSRLLAGVPASTGVGERQSRAKGSGLEFVDRRPYQAGDDIRFLDRHVLERHGEFYLRQYAVGQQLPVTLLVDASVSVAHASPAKAEFVRSLVVGLSVVALGGGDALVAAALRDGGSNWYRPVSSLARSRGLREWLYSLTFTGKTDLLASTRSAARRLRTDGLTILVSDFFSDDVDAALTLLRSRRQEVVGIRVLDPSEIEPRGLGEGLLRLVDAEDHTTSVELPVGTPLLGAYRRELEIWSAELRGLFAKHGGRFLDVRSDVQLERIFLDEWRRAGFLA